MAAWLSREGIPFVKRDVRADPEALEELVQGGFRSTPVTMADGEAVVGYDPEALRALWQAHGRPA